MPTQAILQANTVFIKGEVTFETITVIQKDMITLMHGQSSLSAYQIDLSGVTEVNSAALGLLVELKKYTVAHKKVIAFLNLPERLASLARVYGVADWLELHSI